MNECISIYLKSIDGLHGAEYRNRAICYARTFLGGDVSPTVVMCLLHSLSDRPELSSDLI